MLQTPLRGTVLRNITQKQSVTALTATQPVCLLRTVKSRQGRSYMTNLNQDLILTNQLQEINLKQAEQFSVSVKNSMNNTSQKSWGGKSQLRNYDYDSRFNEL